MLQQRELLVNIKNENNDCKRELEMLNYKIKDLDKHLEKYKEEIGRLQEEREVLNEKVEELEVLVKSRDEEIVEMEHYLK